MKPLSDKIWETRKCRINMEARLIRYSYVSDFLIPWYSLSLILLTLLAWRSPVPFSDVGAVFGSVFILVFSIVGSSGKFRVRAREIKDQYIELDRLYSVSKRMESDNQDPFDSDVFREYQSLLKATPNHREIDYSRLKITLRNSTKKSLDPPRLSDFLLAIGGGILFWATFLALTLLPVLAILLVYR